MPLPQLTVGGGTERRRQLSNFPMIRIILLAGIQAAEEETEDGSGCKRTMLAAAIAGRRGRACSAGDASKSWLHGRQQAGSPAPIPMAPASRRTMKVAVAAQRKNLEGRRTAGGALRVVHLIDFPGGKATLVNAFQQTLKRPV
jgi:hypothetical protein